MFPKAMGHKNSATIFHSVPVQIPVPASQQWRVDSSTIYSAHFSGLQAGECGDTSVETVDTEPHLEALTKRILERLAVPGASAAAEVRFSWALVQALQQCRRSW